MKRSDLKISGTLALGFETEQLPYLYRDDLDSACSVMSKIGYDAVELLIADPRCISIPALKLVLQRNGLVLSAIGTGGGYLSQKLHLCSSDASIRKKAEDYICRIITIAGEFGAATILGRMTGFVEYPMARNEVVKWLTASLKRLGNYACEKGSSLLIEPLNRYESNLINRLEQGLEILGSLDTPHIKLLADLFHMNIEESSITESLRHAGKSVGYLHCSDSNRLALGYGHTDFKAVVDVLSEIRYAGYASMEVFPLPDSDMAAAKALGSISKYLT